MIFHFFGHKSLSIKNFFTFSRKIWSCVEKRDLSLKKKGKFFYFHDTHPLWVKLPWLLSSEPRPTTNVSRLRWLLCLSHKCVRKYPFRPHQHIPKMAILFSLELRGAHDCAFNVKFSFISWWCECFAFCNNKQSHIGGVSLEKEGRFQEEKIFLFLNFFLLH